MVKYRPGCTLLEAMFVKPAYEGRAARRAT
jgi:hypothetical protein